MRFVEELNTPFLRSNENMKKLDIFISIMRKEFQSSTYKYPALREIDVNAFADYLHSYDVSQGVNEEVDMDDVAREGCVNDPKLIIPIEMVPLLRYAMACLLFRMKNYITNDSTLSPNGLITSNFVEITQSKKETRFHSFQVISFHAGVTPMRIEILKAEIEKRLEDKVLVEISHLLISNFVISFSLFLLVRVSKPLFLRGK